MRKSGGVKKGVSESGGVNVVGFRSKEGVYGDAPRKKRKMGGEARHERMWGREVNAPQKKEENVRKLR